MYRQSHSSFGKANFRVNSLPENYSGNAFRSQPVEEEISAEDESCSREENLPVSLPEKENAPLKKGALSDILGSLKMNIASDTALLFLVLLILSAGGGERDDGAVFMILILLML